MKATRNGLAVAWLAAALAAHPLPAGADEAQPLHLPAPVADAELEVARGGQFTEQAPPASAGGVIVDGRLGDNRLSARMTGPNVIGMDAFGRMQGLATVIQNSGNQVLIQNSVLLNLELRP